MTGCKVKDLEVKAGANVKVGGLVAVDKVEGTGGIVHLMGAGTSAGGINGRVVSTVGMFRSVCAKYLPLCKAKSSCSSFAIQLLVIVDGSAIL